MTGYGRGECAQDGFKITVELSSVNRKQSEISVALPRELEVLEAQIRDVINRSIARGRLTARVSLHAADGQHLRHVRLNAPLAKAYVRELNRLAKELKLAGPVTLDSRPRARRFPNRRGNGRRRRFLAGGGEGAEAGPRHAAENARTRRRASGQGPRRAHRTHAQGRRAGPEARARGPETLSRATHPAHQERRRRSARRGRRTAAQGSRLFRRPLGHLRGTDAAAKSFSAVRRLPRVPRNRSAARSIFWRRK